MRFFFIDLSKLVGELLNGGLSLFRNDKRNTEEDGYIKEKRTKECLISFESESAERDESNVNLLIP